MSKGKFIGLFMLLASAISASSAAAFETKMAEHAGGRVEYFVKGKGPIVVFLPSASRSATDLLDIAELVASNGYRVVCPQPRGIGGTVGTASPVTLRDFANDVAAAVDAEGQGPAVILGHAYGSWVARVMATFHPTKVRAVGILAASKRGMPPKHLIDAILRSANADLPEAERLAALRLAFFAEGNDPRVWLKGWFPEATKLQRQAAPNPPQSEWWNAGGKPILEVQADSDPFMPPEHFDDLKKEFGARVKTVRVKNASHAMLPEQPAAVVTAIVEFLKAL